MMGSLFIAACGGSGDDPDTYDEEFDSTMFLPRTDLQRRSEFKTPSGKTWLVIETPMGDSSLVSVSIQAKGFGEDSASFDFGEIDPVVVVHQDDLDKNGYGEIYLITRATGSGSYGTIYGMYSNEDKSVSMISYEGANPYTMKEGEPYDGYMGHDSFVFKDGILNNTFPVYKPEDANAQPTGGDRNVVYELVKGEASVLLRPVRTKR